TPDHQTSAFTSEMAFNLRACLSLPILDNVTALSQPSDLT
ncbi:MAG: hypothetical protein ACI957_000656, partial [Verrucomicrobiales bacterium]